MSSLSLLISCIYSAPCSSVEIFRDWAGETFPNMSHKTMFICEDFNNDLLNPNNHKITDEFIHTMYSMSLYPKITRPTRVTSHCATLIDNVFTNDVNNNTISGLLVNGITDHLPMFTVDSRNYGYNKLDKNVEFTRVKSEEAMSTFKNNLLKQNWDDIYQKKDTDGAYQDFLRIFISLCNKNFIVNIKNDIDNKGTAECLQKEKYIIQSFHTAEN